MEYRKEVFVQQVSLVHRFVRHLSHYRAIKSNRTRKWKDSWFWVDTSNAHLLQGAMCWCMVFGSHGQNEVHLRALAHEPGDAEELQGSFRNRLLATLRISGDQWLTYWEAMVAFRNKYAAHREIGFRDPVPDLKWALEAAFCYDLWVREIISPDVLGGPPLRHLFNELRQSDGREVPAAIESSAAEPSPSSGPARGAGR